MWWRVVLLVASSQISCTRAFSAAPSAPIRWVQFPGQDLVITPAGFPNQLTEPQALTITDRLSPTSPSSVARFAVNPDKTITWNGWCVTAGAKNGDAVHADLCTGGPMQKWNWVPSGHGQEMIQLEGSSKCLAVGEKNGLNGSPIQLRDCDDSTESWMFGDPAPGKSSTSSSLIQTGEALGIWFAMLLPLLGFGRWLWRQGHVRAVATSQGIAASGEVSLANVQSSKTSSRSPLVVMSATSDTVSQDAKTTQASHSRSGIMLMDDAESGGGAAPAAPKKKPRIDALDSLRFFLIAYIASGHFIFTATKNPVVLRLISQINVVVGAFFVISGYVAAYTTTELGERDYTKKRLDDAVGFTVSRVMSYWPLHFLVLTIFSPMFAWVDCKFSGPLTAAWHGLLSTSLLQAWFPLSAEVWNAPTWFLSALTFAFSILPYSLRVLARQSKKQLRRTLGVLTMFSILPKLGYSYDLNAWRFFEGTMSARMHPNYALFNSLRFSPLSALLEVLMGAVACRLVMLDTDEEAKEKSGSSMWPLAGMIGILVLRATVAYTGMFALNDLLTRACFFLPLFITFLMRIHRETVRPGERCKPIVKFLNLGPMKWLGGISFPIFIVHGPVGQLFYKKVVATQLFGGSLARIPGFFGIYWLVVIALSYLLTKCFLQNKAAGQVSKKMSTEVCQALSTQ